MREMLLDLVCCPVTRSPLRLAEAVWDDARTHVQSGTLVSAEGRRYPVRDGVPHLYTGYASPDEEATVSAYGHQWARYDDYTGFMGSAELLNRFLGLPAEAFAGKTVLEVGCGGGRWLRVMAELGAREVVGLDLGTAVVQARRRTADLANVHVVRGSALALPVLPKFELVVSIGAVDHVDDPSAAVREMRRAVRPEHLVALWVYAREGNELYLRVVRPLRWAGPRLPRPVLALLSRTLAGVLWLHVRGSNRVARAAGLALPLGEYCEMLRPLRFRDLECVVYDQLSPTIARYPSRDELLGWLHAAGGEVLRLHHRTGNSWQCHLRLA